MIYYISHKCKKTAARDTDMLRKRWPSIAVNQRKLKRRARINQRNNKAE